MNTQVATHALQAQTQETKVDSNLEAVVVFCLIGFLLTMCALILFPEIGTALGQFT